MDQLALASTHRVKSSHPSYLSPHHV